MSLYAKDIAGLVESPNYKEGHGIRNGLRRINMEEELMGRVLEKTKADAFCFDRGYVRFTLNGPMPVAELNDLLEEARSKGATGRLELLKDGFELTNIFGKCEKISVRKTHRLLGNKTKLEYSISCKEDPLYSELLDKIASKLGVPTQ